MEQNTKKNLIFGGSIAAAALIGLGAGLGIGFGASGNSSNSANTQLASNVKGIGAFSNLDSFDNDGFNYGVREATIEYIDGQGENKGIEDQFTYETKTSQYSDDGAIYVDMIDDYFATNDIIISAGFQVANAIGGNELGNIEGGFGAGFEGLFEKNNGELANSRTKSFVLMDDSQLSQLYTNAASISFAAEGAGYMAGLAAASYTQYDVLSNNPDATEGNIVMWGGMPYNTVYDFLSGFEQAINEWNALDSGFHITLWSGGEDDGDSYEDTDDDGNDKFTTDNKTNSDHWYTGGFDADASTEDGKLAKTKTINAMKAGASVVFPVAGGNTTVAENAIAEDGSTTTKIMGVDADSTLSASHPDLFIGTAEKNLTTGGQYGLWAMDDFDADGQRNYEEVMMRGADTYVAQNPEDTFFATNKDDIISWHETGSKMIGAENEVGVQFRGDASNGGVGFLIGGLNTENTYVVDAVNFLNSSEDEITEEQISEFISNHASDISETDGIESASSTFTTVS